jgi:putative sugar O-methyltransferase
MDSTKSLHRLSDNHPIGASQAERALEMIGSLRALHLSSRDTVRDLGLDPSIFLPGNIWGELDNPTGYFEWTRNKIDLAAAISPFSGFDSMLWRRQSNADYDRAAANAWYAELFSQDWPIERVDLELERRFDWSNRVLQVRDHLIEMWRKLTHNVPAKYHIRRPACAGVVGAADDDGQILNFEVLSHQSRMNALYVAGVLDKLSEKISTDGTATYLEIGPGLCSFAHSLNAALDFKLQVFLVDLTAALGNGCAYLSAVAGAENVGLVQSTTRDALQHQYVLIPNYLVPWYEARLPELDLVHNAISFNEMTRDQVGYYLRLVKRRLSAGGVLNVSQGQASLDYHVDAHAIALSVFPDAEIISESGMQGVAMIELPSTFLRGDVSERA